MEAKAEKENEFIFSSEKQYLFGEAKGAKY